MQPNGSDIEVFDEGFGMKNPFEDLGAPRLENPRGEPCSGVFACQERGCFEATTKARYLREVKVLTWVCPVGHINKIEGFNIE